MPWYPVGETLCSSLILVGLVVVILWLFGPVASGGDGTILTIIIKK
jgi:hypothetical protein